MALPLRGVCSECGRSVEWGADHQCNARSACSECGGRIEADSEEAAYPLGAGRTPGSLELTPEDVDAPFWAREGESATPEIIGRFRIRHLLGGGGSGHVYRAYDSRLEREVALKVLRETRPAARVIERFFREARAAAQLDHPNIVPLHDAGRDAGRCWIAYQFVDGATLNRFREQRRPGLRSTVTIIRDLADALDHSHRRGVFHRDLKPANVLVDARGRPRLTDFGLARRVDFDATMTQDGAILGTPAYMSPEAAAGRSHQADARSDLYSLGIMFYELLCGRRPSDLPSGVPVWRSPVKGPIRRPRSFDRTIPRSLERACLRALAIDPADRHPDARAFAAELTRWLDGSDSGRHLIRAGLLAAILIAAVAARQVAAIASRPWATAPATDAVETPEAEAATSGRIGPR